MARTLYGYFLGKRSYAPTHELMEELLQARIHGRIDRDLVLLLEHEPVITLGRGAHEENLLLTRRELGEAGVEVFETRRGGDVTLHAPGQLVAYPILSLEPDAKDVRRYVQKLTAVMSGVCARHGIATGTKEGMIGLWADSAHPAEWSGAEVAEAPVKVGAIGVRISRWCTSHGFALNLTTDLSLFRYIVPCGIAEYGVGSIAELTGQGPSVEQGAELALSLLAQEFGARAHWTDATTLSDFQLRAVLGLTELGAGTT